MRIAIVLEESLPTEGGGHSYYQTLLAAIDNYQFSKSTEIFILDLYTTSHKKSGFSKQVISVNKTTVELLTYNGLNLFYKFIHRVFKRDIATILERLSFGMETINNRRAKKVLVKEKIQLVYYLKPKEHLIDYPMIITHWDVGHRSMYPFPEVAGGNNFQRRELYYHTFLKRAFLILCESETGARELMYYYPVNPARVRVMPMFGGGVINIQVSEQEQSEILSLYKLKKNNFFLYPAQFWAHKNHAALLSAFSELIKEEGYGALKLLLCGGDKGNLAHTKDIIKHLGIENSVILPGFIENNYLYSFYKNAIALVMPTFLGPTNIPLIEAAHLGCAVACSNLEGHKELLGDHALYFDPSKANEIRDCMKRLLDETLQQKLAAGAGIHIRKSPFQVHKSIPLLDKFLLELQPVFATWDVKQHYN